MARTRMASAESGVKAAQAALEAATQTEASRSASWRRQTKHAPAWNAMRRAAAWKC